MTALAEDTRAVGLERPPLWRRVLGSDHLAGWAFVTPAVILIAVFAVIPIGWAALLSFQANNLLAPAHYIGFANYRALAKDPAERPRTAIAYARLLQAAARTAKVRGGSPGSQER